MASPSVTRCLVLMLSNATYSTKVQTKPFMIMTIHMIVLLKCTAHISFEGFRPALRQCEMATDPCSLVCDALLLLATLHLLINGEMDSGVQPPPFIDGKISELPQIQYPLKYHFPPPPSWDLISVRLPLVAACSVVTTITSFPPLRGPMYRSMQSAFSRRSKEDTFSRMRSRSYPSTRPHDWLKSAKSSVTIAIPYSNAGMDVKTAEFQLYTSQS